MATVIPIGEPVNDAERAVITHLRDHGPASWTVIHNFEIGQDGEKFEVDLAVLTPHAVYLIDVKGTRGLIEVERSRWYPEGRAPFTSPLGKLRGHARTLKGLLTTSNPGRRELEDVFVTAGVILAAPDANLVDPDGRDAPDVTTIRQCVTFLSNRDRVPTRFSRNITPLLAIVGSLIQGKARKRTEPLQFGNWIVTERLGSTDQYTEYRARDAFAGARWGSVLLRVYQADPYLPKADLAAQRARIANAYQALSRLPAHAGIVGAKDFFPNEAEDRFVLAIEDVPGQALRLYLSRPNLALTFDQKLNVARSVLAALAHAHSYEVVHRALNPTTILVGRDGRVRLTGVDFARAGIERSHTIAEQIADELDTHYLAPECHDHPEAASPASDVFAVGLVFYELFLGQRPFTDPADLRQRQGVFPERQGAKVAELPAGMVEWLQSLCAFAPQERPPAAEALAGFERIMAARRSIAPPPPQNGGDTAPDYHNLPKGYALTRKYIIQERLGKPGAFGVVYKVFDTLADADRALKLILRDRYSTTERLRKEYRTLRHLPAHEHVVKVIDADFMPGDGPPFLVFDFLDGLDVGEMLESRLFAPADGLKLAREVASGLVHLHRHGVYHCDIKPRNLLWTEHGTKIIDFNVSVATEDEMSHGGGSRRYLPPDFDLSVTPTTGELADRDLYALGITLYEVITGRYPWDAASPPPGEFAPDPRELSGFADLAPEPVTVLLKAIAPRRAERYASIEELLAALEAIPEARSTSPALVETPGSILPLLSLTGLAQAKPNTNPYVAYLLTLYSQSQRSNSGTRGLDALSEQLYVETALDRELIPAVLAGEFRLVLITGNAGDGKTAFLQKLGARARHERAVIDDSLPNGCRFTMGGRRFLCNYDGSQDEGDQPNEAVLDAFFAPFRGADAAEWPGDETRLIAINEGRLIDFLESRAEQFPRLTELVRRGLATGVPEAGIAVVNLNLRSVIADPTGEGHSLLERLLQRMTQETFWTPCLACDLKDRCYIHHNVRTFQDPTAGPRVFQRLKTLYMLTHQITERWVETHLMDVVNRGKATQAIAAPRPLHGFTYRFRNPKHSRPYGADEHLYEMLTHARGQRGTRALEHLKDFFFAGIDKVTHQVDNSAQIDVETQALLRLMNQVKEDAPDSRKGRESYPPLCVGASDLLAEDVLRLLFYQRFIPRSVMVDYLKVLFGFHLALYHLRLIKLLPVLVKRRAADPTCAVMRCPMDPRSATNPHGDCPYRVGIFLDIANRPGTPTARLAERSADIWYRRIPGFVKAYFAVKKLDEFASSRARQGKLTRPSDGLAVADVLPLLEGIHKGEREPYFKARLANVLEDSRGSEEALAPEIVQILEMGLPAFDTYIELIIAHRGDCHRRYFVECLDSLLMKNRPGALIAQPRVRNAPRRFILDSRLLEVLLQIAVLRPGGAAGYHTASLPIEEVLLFLRERYGLYIDRLPSGDGFGPPSIQDRAALRKNVAAMTARLREIGFYRDLSDAYITQTVTPRYVIDRRDNTGGAEA